jgi:sporulation protein YqfC
MIKRRMVGNLLLSKNGADVYAPPLPGLPIIEMVGDRRLLIENHNGVTGYSDTDIYVRVKYGELRVSGDCLSLSYMSKCQLVITGCIHSIHIGRR